jgi:hypothetical protein
MRTFTCKAPEGETAKAYKVWNGNGYSYLAKSQMYNVSISGDTMTFCTSDWFAGIHKDWLIEVNNTSNTQNV